MPKPNQTMNSGTSATFGTTWEATINGRSARSSQAIRPRTAPMPTPRTSAMPKPTRVSVRVTVRWVMKSCACMTSTMPPTTSSGCGSTNGEMSKTAMTSFHPTITATSSTGVLIQGSSLPRRSCTPEARAGCAAG